VQPSHLALAALVLCVPLGAQTRTVAITVDDLPFAGPTGAVVALAEPALAKAVNSTLLEAFTRHKVPVTGFVNGKRSEALGPTVGSKILAEWVARGFDLGNHTYSHPDANKLSVSEIQDEIVRGESPVSSLMRDKGKKLEFFRFPMNHTGDTREKHDTISAFLAKRGYKLATCTIDNADYLFNDAYLQLLAKKDKRSAQKLRLEYIAYTSSEIDYYASLSGQVLGYEPPQVMLLHDNRLNADVVDEVLRLFQHKGYRFVSLRTAQSDPAYSIPDTYITPYGPMWGYRWAKEKNAKVDGKLEPEPPQWVVDLAGLKKPHQESRAN
jgi:peptidoglycan-N-acetylglucosamine deacetylase